MTILSCRGWLSVLVVAMITLAIGLSAEAAPPFTLKSTSVELPDSQREFPKATGVETVSANCVTCHSPGMILNQPALSKASWDAEVHKMITVYKAPVAEADVAAIVNYLVEVKGAK